MQSTFRIGQLEHRAPYMILVRFRKHCYHKEMAGGVLAPSEPPLL
jgi:hypothetical protein